MNEPSSRNPLRIVLLSVVFLLVIEVLGALRTPLWALWVIIGVMVSCVAALTLHALRRR